jgi:hypothetical protein
MYMLFTEFSAILLYSCKYFSIYVQCEPCHLSFHVLSHIYYITTLPNFSFLL